MRKRELGKAGVEIVPLVLGGNVFGWTADEAQSMRVLDAFAGRGFNCVDTANIYSTWVAGHVGGESEKILGRWLKRSGRRAEMVVLTKVGMAMPDGQGLRMKYILREAEASLRRLQTDYIDLYQAHQDDETTPLEETREAFGRLMEQGKVRAIGASNYKAARLVEAMETADYKGTPAYTTLQPEYNLHSREGFERELQPVAKRFGLGVIPYYSLAAGFLSGKYRTAEDAAGARSRRVASYFDDRGVRILAALRQVAEETGSAPATVALAWLLAQPTVVAPIASATKVEQLEELCAAVELELTEAQEKALTEASAS